MSESELSDLEAVQAARGGDHEAFRVLVERYEARAFRLALRILRDEDRARDATQEALIKVYRSLDRFEGRSRFYTWLYRIVTNACLDQRRRENPDRRADWPDEPDTDPTPAIGAPVPTPSSPARALEQQELGRQIADAIEDLPEDARQTLLLREVDGLSYAEIAETLEIPKGTVMSRLHHARKRVQKTLAEQGLQLGDEEKPE